MCVGEGLSPAGYVENSSGSKQSTWRALGSTYLDVGNNPEHCERSVAFPRYRSARS